MGDVYDKVRDSRTGLEKLLDFIPGWSGYQERQTRRKADQLLRQTLADKLADQRRRLDTAQKELIGHGRVDLVDEVGSAGTQLQTFIDRVRFASYGYAGLFVMRADGSDQSALVWSYPVGFAQLAAGSG